jgi:hypothetical protein
MKSVRLAVSLNKMQPQRVGRTAMELRQPESRADDLELLQVFILRVLVVGLVGPR